MKTEIEKKEEPSKKESEKIAEKEKEKSNDKSKNFFINYKDLFITQEFDTSKEKEEKKEKEDENKQNIKNREDLSYLKQLYTFPEVTDDCFRNKDLKFRFISNKNIRFHDEYTVSYEGKGASKIDYGTVQPEKEITNSRPVFYFEVFIKNDGKENDILIGLGEKDITEKGLSLGSTTRSYGYHSKGKSHNNKKVNKYGEIYTNGDTVGCGVDLENKSIFFTKNGKFLDYAFKDINFEFGKGYLYPSVCLHSLRSEIVINFGKNNFKFDIKQYYENNLGKKYNELQKINPKFDEMDSLVKEYLFFEGYLKTLKSMVSNDNKENKNNIEKLNDIKDNNNLNCDNNMQIDEIKKNENIINLGDNNISMEIEEEEYQYENDMNLIENILKLLPKEIKEQTKPDEKEKKEEKKEEKKDEKKKEKKEEKKEEKKDEKKEEKKDEKKDEKKEEKKDEKKDEKKEEKKDEKKEEKKEEKNNKMNIEKDEKVENEKDYQERKNNLKKLITFRRKIMNYFSNNDFDKAIALIKEEQQIKGKDEIKKKIYFNIMIMKYLTLLKNQDNYISCFELLDSFEKEYWDKYKILLYENANFKETKLFSVQNLATLVSQPDIMNSNDAFFLNNKQIELIIDQINSLLFELFNFSKMSNLEILFAHLEYMNGLYFKTFNFNQELNLKLD